MAPQLKTALSPVRPSVGRHCGEYHGRWTTWVSKRGPMQHSVKRRDWGNERGQGPGSKDLPECRTLVMMMMMMMMMTVAQPGGGIWGICPSRNFSGIFFTTDILSLKQ